jgi:hypothetical protein
MAALRAPSHAGLGAVTVGFGNIAQCHGMAHPKQSSYYRHRGLDVDYGDGRCAAIFRSSPPLIQGCKPLRSLWQVSPGKLLSIILGRAVTITNFPAPVRPAADAGGEQK